MYDQRLHNQINHLVKKELDISGADNAFYIRLLSNASSISQLYDQLYKNHPQATALFDKLIKQICITYKGRMPALKKRDEDKPEYWFLSNELAGMSLYVDRFCGNIKNLSTKLDYLKDLGINFLHLMPLFQSPQSESDGGYAVSDFRKIDARYGTIDDLKAVREAMSEKQMYLMLDIVLNHTSRLHEWAEKAKAGDSFYQDYFYFFDNREGPDLYDKTMPEIFPEAAPGNFTYVEECGKWVMTVFHHYQWDLNYTNPNVFVDILENIFFYANLGVDLLRIDAPAFIWKQPGTTSQNLPEAHTLLRLIKLCIQTATPGMAILGEAIVSPREIIKYFGTGEYRSRECDFAYNATQMALQWDALATGDIRVMMNAQEIILKKPYGTSWITYTRSHDDIGLGYEDAMIERSGWSAFEHRNFLKEYYSGVYPASNATGALFSSNPKTGDARISGTLASLCGLEKTMREGDQAGIVLSIKKILLMQAQSFFIGGMPMMFYGDELAHTNDYSYLDDPDKSYDNRWMHRPFFQWNKLSLLKDTENPESNVFYGTRRLLQIRKKLGVVADHSNLTWLTPHNVQVAAFIRAIEEKKIYCLFNFSAQTAYTTWYTFREHGDPGVRLYDHWQEKYVYVGSDHEYLILEPYSFCVMESL